MKVRTFWLERMCEQKPRSRGVLGALADSQANDAVFTWNMVVS